MIFRPPVTCRLIVDGCEVQAKISPYICDYGFWLWNDAPCSNSHYHLAPLPETLREILLREAGKPFSVDLHSEYLGHVDENRGYAAADMGPYTRPVTSLVFSVGHNEGKSAFRFEGIAGPVAPATIFQGGESPQTRTPFKFAIEFEISDEQQYIYFVDATALQAVQAYVQSNN